MFLYSNTLVCEPMNKFVAISQYSLINSRVKSSFILEVLCCRITSLFQNAAFRVDSVWKIIELKFIIRVIYPCT